MLYIYIISHLTLNTEGYLDSKFMGNIFTQRFFVQAKTSRQKPGMKVCLPMKRAMNGIVCSHYMACRKLTLIDIHYDTYLHFIEFHLFRMQWNLWLVLLDLKIKTEILRRVSSRTCSYDIIWSEYSMKIISLKYVPQGINLREHNWMIETGHLHNGLVQMECETIRILDTEY